MANIIENILSFEGDKILIKDIMNLIKEADIPVYDFNDTEIFFGTKSSPPIPFLRKLSEQFPEVIFDLIYTDDTGGGAGQYKIQNGEIRLLVTNDVTIEEWCFIRINLCDGGNFSTARKFTLTDIWRDVRTCVKIIFKLLYDWIFRRGLRQE